MISIVKYTHECIWADLTLFQFFLNIWFQPILFLLEIQTTKLYTHLTVMLQTSYVVHVVDHKLRNNLWK